MQNTKDWMGMLGLQYRVDELERANGLRWHGHVLRKDDDHVLRRAWTSK